LAEQELGAVGAILPGDAGDQSDFSLFLHGGEKRGQTPIFPHSSRRRPATYIAAFGSSWTTRGASPTLPSPPGRDLLTLQTGSPDMSEATVLFADVSGSKRLIETAGDAVALKAIARCIEWLCEIVSQAASTALLVRLTYRDQAVECSREHPSVVIGREYGCGLMVSDRTASRKHCTVELRGGQFVVQDHSTNGTYVTIDSEKSVLLKGDDLALRRFGWIGFSDVRYAGSDVVQFSCG